MSNDFRLYCVTTQTPELSRSHRDMALAAAKGGATIIQFRDKILDDREFEKTALDVKTIADTFGIPLIVNDRIDIGVAIGAAGVHVGQEDMSIRRARKLIAAGALIGCSATSAEEAKQAEASGADYIGAGPVFPTGSKDDAALPIGLVELRRICTAVKIPVVAIGGITKDNIGKIKDTGAAGAAVISAISRASDMEQATVVLKNIWETK